MCLRFVIGLAALFLDILKLAFLLIVTLLNVLDQLRALAKGSHDVLHVMSLTTDQSAEMENNTLSFVTLTEDGDIGVLEGRKLFLVAFPLTLKLLSNLLLKYESLESVVTLLLSAGQTSAETSSIILLLVDKARETSVFALVGLDLDLEVLRLFGELFSECLEFEELSRVS